MSSAAMVPVFSPDGTLGDIPQSKLVAAVKAGAKPGVHITSPDGKDGVVPANRMADAVKAGAKIVPLDQQPIQHPGFWSSLGSDLKAMVPGMSGSVGAFPEMALPVQPHQLQQASEGAAQSDADRAAAGRSMPYRAAATVAQAGGVNVPGMEKSAAEGDVAGVAGHAAAVPTAMAVTAGLAKGAPVISDAAERAATRMATAAEKVTPKQAAQVVGATSGAAAGHGTLSPVGAYYGAKTFGHIAEAVLRKDRANAPIFQKAAEQGITLDQLTEKVADLIAKDREASRDATGQNIPYAGTEPLPTATTAEAPKFTTADRAAAKSLLEDALQQHTSDVIDSAIPGKSTAAKAQIEFYLKKGDVGGAEAVLDKSAKAANPAWQPLDRQPVPSVNEIRERVQAEAKMPRAGSAADAADDRALQQEMNWNLQRHGWAAESEARREFIARNSNYFNKSGKSRGYVPGETVKYTKTPGVKSAGTAAPAAGSASATAASDDLSEMLQKSLDQVRGQQ